MRKLYNIWVIDSIDGFGNISMMTLDKANLYKLIDYFKARHIKVRTIDNDWITFTNIIYQDDIDNARVENARLE